MVGDPPPQKKKPSDSMLMLHPFKRLYQPVNNIQVQAETRNILNEETL